MRSSVSGVDELLAGVGEPDVAAFDLGEMKHLQSVGDREQLVHLQGRFVGDHREIGLAFVRLAGQRFEEAGEGVGGDARQDGVDAHRHRSYRALRARGHRHVDFLDQVAELRIEAVARLLEIDRDLANDASGVGREQKDAVAHQHRLLDVVGHEDDALDRQLAVAPELEEVGAQGFRRQHVERRERLVHEQDVGMDDERAGEADALAHAAGKLARIGGFVAVEPDEIDRGERAPADLRLRQPQRLEAELHVFEHREPGKEREGLKHHRNPGRRPDHLLAEIGDGSSGRRHEARDQAQQRRLARPGAAEQPDDLPLPELQLDAVEHQKLAAVGARKSLTQSMNIEQRGAHGVVSLLALSPGGTCARRSGRAAARRCD